MKRDFLRLPSRKASLLLCLFLSLSLSANSSRSQIATRFKEAKVGSVSSASSFLKPQGHPAASGQTVRQTLTAASAKVSNRCARALVRDKGPFGIDQAERRADRRAD